MALDDPILNECTPLCQQQMEHSQPTQPTAQPHGQTPWPHFAKRNEAPVVKVLAAGWQGSRDSNPRVPPGPLPTQLLNRVKVLQHGVETSAWGPPGPGPHPKQPRGWGGADDFFPVAGCLPVGLEMSTT